VDSKRLEVGWGPLGRVVDYNIDEFGNVKTLKTSKQNNKWVLSSCSAGDGI
jgi:hypothetical protein